MPARACRPHRKTHSDSCPLRSLKREPLGSLGNSVRDIPAHRQNTSLNPKPLNPKPALRTRSAHASLACRPCIGRRNPRKPKVENPKPCLERVKRKEAQPIPRKSSQNRAHNKETDPNSDSLGSKAYNNSYIPLETPGALLAGVLRFSSSSSASSLEVGFPQSPCIYIVYVYLGMKRAPML